MNILLLGGAGFIGSHLAVQLAADGHRLTVVDNRFRPTGIPLGRAVQQIPRDVRELEPWVFREPYDECYILASVVGVPNVEQHPRLTWEVQIAAVRLALALNVGRVFLASTSEVYGGDCPVTHEDKPVVIPATTSRRASYAAAKAWAENAVATSGVPYVIGRFHNVYGPWMGYDHVIPRFLVQAESDSETVQVDDPTAVRAFCYVSDAVAGIRTAMAAGENLLVNIGNPHEPLTIRTLMERVLLAVNREKTIVCGDTPGFPRVRIPDVRRLQRLGWEPTVPLALGLAKMQGLV